MSIAEEELESAGRWPAGQIGTPPLRKS